LGFAPSIRQKLIGISMVTVICATVAAGTIFFVTSQRAYRDLVERDVRSTAGVIADSSTAALSFGDPETAAEILKSLEATPHLDLACLYDAHDRLFAGYTHISTALVCPSVAAGTSRTVSNAFAVRRAVVLDNRHLGSLYLQRNFDDLTAYEREQMFVLAMIIGGALGLALFLSSLLQRFVSAPVRHLVDTARLVSERKDYSIRAAKQTDDELGVLVESFNEMLTQVETRTSQLQAIRRELEQKVSELQREVAERRRMEEERSELLRREQEASRLKDEFLATVSHELRTPLNAILGWSRMLASELLDQPAADRALQTIERNARVQAHLIEDLLDISRIMSGRMRLDVHALDLRPVIDAALDAVKPAAEARHITLDKVIDTSVGQVFGDSNRLQQVIWNLLSNAVKFTPEGRHVQIRLQRAGAHVEIVVADTGQGISPDFLPYVFDSFRQADSTSTRMHGGLGLGLAIVRHLVELHGGSVRAQSPGVGQGSTFIVQLPQLEADTARESRVERAPAFVAAPGAPPAPPSKVRLDGIRVLVVEDEEDTLSLLTTVLGHYGAEVRGVRSVEKAIETVGAWRVDVVVSDIGLPGEDGYSFIHQLRALAPERGGNAPAIALTAYARTSDRVRALSSGFQMHIPKPVEPAELISAIGSLAVGPRGGSSMPASGQAGVRQ
jgi:signal transduction histidine kinase/ActR/RegA family two-component response regulator